MIPPRSQIKTQPQPAAQPAAQPPAQPRSLVPWTSTGKFSLNQLARSHAMSAPDLVNTSLAAGPNDQLARYVAQGNYNLPVPQGVPFYIPQTNWRA
jgi:hypothetical protein